MKTEAKTPWWDPSSLLFLTGIACVLAGIAHYSWPVALIFFGLLQVLAFVLICWTRATEGSK